MEDNKQKRYEKPKMPRSPLFWVLVALLGLLLISTTLSTSSYLRGSTEKVDVTANRPSYKREKIVRFARSVHWYGFSPYWAW